MLSKPVTDMKIQNALGAETYTVVDSFLKGRQPVRFVAIDCECGRSFESRYSGIKGLFKECQCVKDKKSFDKISENVKPIGATLVGYLGHGILGKRKVSQFIMLFKCDNCGIVFKAARAQGKSSANGLSHVCECLKYAKVPKQEHTTEEWQNLSRKVRGENVKAIGEFEKDYKCKHDAVECCANCGNFETIDCKPYGDAVHLIDDMFNYKCDDFKEV